MSLRFYIYARKSQESDERQELSIPAQLDELHRLAKQLNLTVIDQPYEEARTARKPGRPLFNQMMANLEAGRADGILCWKLDRLARNLVDGGRVVYDLGQGAIKQIVVPGHTYVGDSTEKLMMTFEFGTATKYSDDISDNVRRSNRAYLERGAWTGCPKLGYMRRRPQESTSQRERRGLPLVPDPVRFPIVRSMWTRLLAGTPPLDILKSVRQQGLTTPKRGKVGGRLLCRSGMYAMFRDEFYTGVMIRANERYPGSHPPVVTRAEFDQAQVILDGKIVSRPKAKNLFFPYRGLVRCGSCGSMATARRLTKRNGVEYVYYHCYRKERRYKFCPEPAVDARAIDAALERFLAELAMPPAWLDRLLEHLAERAAGSGELLEADRVRKESAVAELFRKQERLRAFLVDGVITKDEYQRDHANLARERERLEDEARQTTKPAEYLEPWIMAGEALRQAPFWLASGIDSEKQLLAQKLTWNLQLKDRTVLIRAKKPLTVYRAWRSCPSVLAFLDHVDANISNADARTASCLF